MGQTRVFYVAYTWQMNQHEQRIGSSVVTLTNVDKLTNDEVVKMRDSIADDLGASRGSMVVTFFAELEA